MRELQRHRKDWRAGEGREGRDDPVPRLQGDGGNPRSDRVTTTLGKPKASLLTDLERIIHSKDGLEREIADLRTQREDLRRFLDIDAEKAELEALRSERVAILTEAKAEASRIVEAAHAQAEKVAADGRTTLDALTAAERASASRRADEVTAEALRAATAMRESAAQGLDAARKEAVQIVADAESRIAE